MPPWGWVGIAAAALVALVLGIGIVWHRAATNHGEVRIAASDSQVPVIVKHDGEPVLVLTPGADQSNRLPPGEYDVELQDNADHLQVGRFGHTSSMIERTENRTVCAWYLAVAWLP